MKQLILILDCGGQYKKLIASAVRNLNVYSQILPISTPTEKIKQLSPIGIILTGGHQSTLDKDSPKIDKTLLDLNIPILGICYGMHLICTHYGGKITATDHQNHTTAQIKLQKNIKSKILPNTDFDAVFNHKDYVLSAPSLFTITSTANNQITSIENHDKNIFGTQFYLGTKRIGEGDCIIKKFVFDVCKAKGDYNIDDYLTAQIQKIRAEVGSK
ncbi:MAG: gamma-glutamyl-gamma-aminobutyrate hydrolase family protein, partial [Firmicutes bacterium]|nr:gamma-glutamyl-gamma-aminobutyrate hydrolase family protein [Bacillota bacterium]